MNNYLRVITNIPKISDEGWEEFDETWGDFAQTAEIFLSMAAPANTTINEIKGTLHLILSPTLKDRWRNLTIEQKNAITTLDQLRAALEPHVGEKPDGSLPFGKFTTRVQGPVESVRTYYNDLYRNLLRASGNAGEVNAPLLHAKFTSGLRPELQTEAIKAANMAEALKNCERLEKALTSGRPKNEVVVGAVENPFVAAVEMLDKMVERRVGEAMRGRSPQRRSQEGCYNCGQRGHIARFCQAPQSGGRQDRRGDSGRRQERRRTPTPQGQRRPQQSSSQQTRTSDLVCQFCDRRGHSAKECRSIGNDNNRSRPQRQVAFDNRNVSVVTSVEDDYEQYSSDEAGNDEGTLGY